MGPSRQSASRLGGLISDVSQRGAEDALRQFNLQSLAGAPASEVFVALTDVLCPDGGTIDEAIARSALLETAAELAASGDVPFDAMTQDGLEAVFLGTIARSIETKLFNELGAGAVVLTSDVSALREIQRTLHDYIMGTVGDAFSSANQSPVSMPRADIDQFVARIYENAFALLEAFEEQP